MADTAGKGLQGTEHGNHGVSERTVRADIGLDRDGVRGRTGWGSAELGNTDIEGLEGRDIGRDSGGERPARETSTEFRYPLYPPGPGDRDGWARLLREYPELEPTFCKEGHMLPEMQETQSDLRRTPYGTPSGVDLRLRAVGNGVVPAVAGRAFRELARELELEWLFKEQGNTNS